MLYEDLFSQFRGKRVTVEMQNGAQFNGVMKHIDMHYNVVLTDLEFPSEDEYGLVSWLKRVLIRGANVKFITVEGF